jgi:hypothetical protein
MLDAEGLIRLRNGAGDGRASAVATERNGLLRFGDAAGAFMTSPGWRDVK